MRVGRLHILTDYFFQQRYSHRQIAVMAMAGGADTIQFRQKHGDIGHILRESGRTVEVCRQRGVTCVVNDRIDVALAVEADGVHLGQEDFPIAHARRILRETATIGASATTVEQALRAEKEGATYIGFGPVFPTASKPNPSAVKGVAGLARVCEAVSIPVIAIAGITADRVAEVLQAGAYGIAVMTAVTVSDDPEAATAAFARALAAITGG